MTGEDEPEAGTERFADRSLAASGSAAVETGPAEVTGPDAAQAPAAGQVGSPASRNPAGAPRARHGRAGSRRRPLLKELPILVAAALVIALLIKTFVVQAFYIPSGSMQNTLEIGDKVLVNKLVYHVRPIRAGDIIVFDGTGSWDAPPSAPTSGNPVAAAYNATLRPLLHAIGGLFGTAPGQTDYIKRVIGVPGDHLACCNSQGLITVNGVPLHEKSYLFPGNRPADAPAGEQARFRLTVPPGRLWVLGDHRDISDDSRGHVADPGNGTIPENKVIGRAFMIVWPPGRWRVLSIPATFSQPGVTPAATGRAGGPAGAAGAAGAERKAATASLATGARLSPAAPYLPLGGGLAGALPLTYLRRRLLLRRRAGRPRRKRRRVGEADAG